MEEQKKWRENEKQLIQQKIQEARLKRQLQIEEKQRQDEEQFHQQRLVITRQVQERNALTRSKFLESTADARRAREEAERKRKAEELKRLAQLKQLYEQDKQNEERAKSQYQ